MISHSNESHGFTLIEIMVSLVIFSLVSASMATVYLSQLSHNNTAEARSGAIGAAQQRLDALRIVDVSTMPTSGSDNQTITIDGRNFTVRTSYCLDSSYCATSNTRHLRVDVTYRERELYHTETVYTQLR